MGDHSRHEAGSLKQKNKAHKTRHTSKREMDNILRGRVESKHGHTKRKLASGKEDRRNHNVQVRKNKREAALDEKRSLGTECAPPHLIVVVSLSASLDDAVAMRDALISSVAPDFQPEGRAPTEVVTVFSAKLRKRVAVVAAPQELFAILELAKVADSVLMLMRVTNPENEFSEQVATCLCAQGVPTLTHAIIGLDDVPQKRRNEVKKNLSKLATDKFSTTKVHSMEKPSDAQTLLWSIVNQKQRHVRWREIRSHILVQNVEYAQEDGVLRLTGYVRSQPLNVNGLVHLPGLGARQIACILGPEDPCAKGPSAARSRDVEMGEQSRSHVLAMSEPELQESLQCEVPVDHMAGEQTWPTEEEEAAAEAEAEAMELAEQSAKKVVRVPKGTSSYQAAWIVDDEGGEGGEEGDEGNASEGDNSSNEMDQSDEEGPEAAAEEADDGEDMWSQHMKSVSFAPDADMMDLARRLKSGQQPERHDDEEEEEYEDLEVNTSSAERAAQYDDENAAQQDEETLEKLRAADEDAAFPDEVDTPANTPARIRFQKYRGLQSFRTSQWDPKEELPVEYSRIFQFQDFERTKHKVMKKANSNELLHGEVPIGAYVTVCVTDVPPEYVATRDPQMPYVLFGLVEHENKMSVVNYVLRMHSSCTTPIKSKEPLVFLAGPRTFMNRPIFSSHTKGSKQKFERYFQPGTVAVATMIAPIAFPPGPVLAFRETESGLQLVATGSFLEVNPDRLVIKRIRLTGYPFKIHKRSAVIRLMFFNPEDIAWFKPIELATKMGRRGHIKESLGTHGHMKCYFDGPLRQDDTIVLNLYKRVFPKWHHTEYAPSLGSALPFSAIAGASLAEMEA